MARPGELAGLARRGNWPAWPGMVTFVSMFEAAGWLENLNDEQRRAATHPGGPLLVLAGAGTGKTGTLVARAAWLRSQGVRAGRILLLTFTRRAADDILARVAPTAVTADERICGGTFHAIAHRIIREHAESFSLPPQFSVLDPADVTDVLDTLRADHDLVGTRRRAPRAAVCADIYTRCVNTRTPVADVYGGHLPVVHRLHPPARRPVPRIRGAQAPPWPGRLR